MKFILYSFLCEGSHVNKRGKGSLSSEEEK